MKTIERHNQSSLPNHHSGHTLTSQPIVLLTAKLYMYPWGKRLELTMGC
jgi:hypothetical protein